MKCVNIIWLMMLTACASRNVQTSPVATLLSTPTASTTPTLLPFHTSTPYPTATPPAWLLFNTVMALPAPLYYEAGGAPDTSCPLPHLVRLSQVGGTPTTVGSCFILGGFNGFDISPMDGSIVIAARGALWGFDAEGKNPRRLIEALPNPEIMGNVANISDPAWSPNGEWIAYADGGIRVVNMASGKRTDVIEDKCFDDGLFSSVGPCFYGVWYQTPDWSPDSTMLLFKSQNADYFYQMLYSISKSNSPTSIPGTAGVTVDNIAWGRDQTTLLFDYWWPLSPGIPNMKGTAFIRLNWDTGNTDIIWAHSDRADPVFASAGNNPWQVRHPFETSDGRILFFQAEPCDSESCYKYALVEATHTTGGYNLTVLHHNALPDGAREVIWHDSGEYIAFIIGSYNGPWYIAVMRVPTGEMFLINEEQQPPSHLMWGRQ